MIDTSKPIDRQCWAVWRIGTVPYVLHETARQAEEEARRLALSNPGIEYYVIKILRKAFVPLGLANVMVELPQAPPDYLGKI